MPQDPFAQYAVKPAPAADPFAQYTQPAPVQQAPASGVKGFAQEFWKRTNPIETIKGLVHAAGDLPGTVGSLIKADPAFLTQAQEAANKGDYPTAVRKFLSYMSMGLGHELDTQADLLQQGEYGRATGAMAGTATNFVAPAVVGKVLGGRQVPALAANRDPAVARAVETGRAAGVPIDAATASGNPFVKFAQKTADESMLGSLVGQRARTAQQTGLTRMGEDLAGQAHPTAVSPGQAGAAAQAGGRAAVKTQRQAANTAYNRLREIEADPATASTFQPEVTLPGPNAPFSFTAKIKPTADEVFAEALKDARANGYTGKVSDLRAKFDTAIDQAKSLKAATAEGAEYSHAALLKEIRARGGLRPTDPDFLQGAPTRQMRGEHQSAQQANRQYYGKNAIYRTDGKAVDQMLQELSEDPKWGAVITADTDLIDVIHRGGLRTPDPLPGNLEHHLRGVGVQPGATWWNEGAPAQTVHMAVDLSPVKEAMRPIYDRLAQQHAIVPLSSLTGEGKAFVTLDRLINGPDVAPLSVADSALSDLKGLARSNNPDLRTAGQGIAAKAVSELHQMVAEAAERAGPAAVTALTEGRAATVAKYAAADILRKLEGRQGTKSPVTALRGMTQAGDANVGHLREVLTQTPTAKPLIGRAVLDGLIDSPTMGPDASFKAWQRLGPDTKYALYTPEHIRALDDFFLLRKKIAENPNPSGSGLTVLKGGELLLREPGLTIGLPALSALLHSPAGVALLTKGFRLPGRSTVAMTGYAGELSKAAERAGVPLQQLAPAAAGQTPEAPAPGPGAANLQRTLEHPYQAAGQAMAGMAGSTIEALKPLVAKAQPYLEAVWKRLAPYGEPPKEWNEVMAAIQADPNIDPLSKKVGGEVVNQIAMAGTPLGVVMSMAGLGPAKPLKKAAGMAGEAAGSMVDDVVSAAKALFPRLDNYGKATGRITGERILAKIANAADLSPEARAALEKAAEQVGTRRVAADELHAIVKGETYTPERTIRRVTAVKEGAEQIPGAPIGITNARQERALRERYLDTIERGAGGREWYHDSGKDVLAYANDDPVRANLVAGDLAITSPATSVSANTGMGVKGYNQATAGVPVSAGRFPTAMGKAIEEAHAAGGAESIGLKRTPFQQNVARGGGFNVSSDPPRAVHDIWDGEAWGFMNEDGTPMRQGFSPAQHRWMDKQQDLMLKEANRRAIGGHTNWEELRSQAAAWTGQQIKAGVLDPKDAAKSYADHLSALVAQGSRETVPGRTTRHMPELLKPDADAERQLLHEMVSKESGIYDAKGRDQIAAGYGGLVGRSFEGPGLFEGNVSPGRQTQVLTGSLESLGGPKNARELDAGSRRIMDAAEATHGLLMGQDASAYSRVLPAGSGQARNAWDVILPDGTLKAEQMRALVQRIGKDAALIPTPDGVRIAFTDEKTMKAAVKALGGKVKAAGTLQGNFISNDWQIDRVGQGYMGAIRDLGSEKFDRFAPAMAERLRGIDARFAKETGGKFTLSPVMDEVRAAVASDGFAGLERLAKKYSIPAILLAAALAELKGAPGAGNAPS